LLIFAPKILTVFIILSITTAYNQGDQNFSLVGGFGGPTFSTTKIDQGTSLIIGGGGAAVFTPQIEIDYRLLNLVYLSFGASYDHFIK